METSRRPLIIADAPAGVDDPYVPLSCDLLVFHPDLERAQTGRAVAIVELQNYITRRRRAIAAGQEFWDPCDTEAATRRLDEAVDAINEHYCCVPAFART